MSELVRAEHAACLHHWIIGGGREPEGRCKHCGAMRVFHPFAKLDTEGSIGFNNSPKVNQRVGVRAGGKDTK